MQPRLTTLFGLRNGQSSRTQTASIRMRGSSCAALVLRLVRVVAKGLTGLVEPGLGTFCCYHRPDRVLRESLDGPCVVSATLFNGDAMTL